MKSMFIISFVALLGITGCTKCNHPTFSSEGVGCEKLRAFWKEWEEDKIKTIAVFGEDSNDPIANISLGEFEKRFFELVPGCCFCRPHPLANEWTECNRLDCIWKYIESEGVLRIAFYRDMADVERPENWDKPWADITEPEKTKEVLKLLYKAMEKENDIYANEISSIDQMQIITSKHKFIIPISCYYGDAIRGIGWTSQELRKKLNQWGFSR
jgi:hypothetical protein